MLSDVNVDLSRPGAPIACQIYGHFAEHLGRGIYEGIWVGPDSDIPNTNGFRNDVLQALRDLQVPVIRWLGGCFADLYDWRDGTGPGEDRPVRINVHWGGVTDNNAVGTHESWISPSSWVLKPMSPAMSAHSSRTIWRSGWST